MNRRKIISLKKGELTLLTLLSVSAVMTFSWVLSGAVLYSDIDRLRTKLFLLEEEIAEIENLLNDKIAIEAGWLALENLGKELNKAFPPEEDLPAVLDGFEEAIQGYRDLIGSINIGELFIKENISKIDISINFSGPAYRLERLLGELEGFPHSLIMENVNWVNHDNLHADLQIEISLLFYHRADIPEVLPETEVP